MAEIKQLYTLQTDEDFSRLSFPLNSREIRQLEQRILEYGCTTPIRVWNSYIVMDFEI